MEKTIATLSSSHHLMMTACRSINLLQAFKRICKKNTSPGYDEVTKPIFEETYPSCILQAKNLLLYDNYLPSPLRIALIHQHKKIRKLLIPTFHDRFIQQAILQVLQPYFEPFFSIHSFGYRPKRNAQQALLQAINYIKQGDEYIIQLDFKNFFDEINHDILLSRIKLFIDNDKLLNLIHHMIKAPTISQEKIVVNEKGIPQGAPISPLLANIYLDMLDKELEHRGYRFCRYADDCRIFIKNPSEAKEILSCVTDFVERRLKLEINQNKTYIGLASNQEFLGFVIQPNLEVGLSEKRIAIMQKIAKKMRKTHKNLQRKKIYSLLKHRFHYHFSLISPINKNKLEKIIFNGTK